jgi:hypothetical protein
VIQNRRSITTTASITASSTGRDSRGRSGLHGLGGPVRSSRCSTLGGTPPADSPPERFEELEAEATTTQPGQLCAQALRTLVPDAEPAPVASPHSRRTRRSRRGHCARGGSAQSRACLTAATDVGENLGER